MLKYIWTHIYNQWHLVISSGENAEFLSYFRQPTARVHLCYDSIFSSDICRVVPPPLKHYPGIVTRAEINTTHREHRMGAKENFVLSLVWIFRLAPFTSAV